MKTLNTVEYVTALRSLTEAGETVSMQVAGSSMTPFLADTRDAVSFSRPQTPLRPGDIVFYRRDSGAYVMHRIKYVHKNGVAEDTYTYDIVGDGQTEAEKGIRREQIFARITAVRRKGKVLDERSPLWQFFARVWPYIPYLHAPVLGLVRLMRRRDKPSGAT